MIEPVTAVSVTSPVTDSTLSSSRLPLVWLMLMLLAARANRPLPALASVCTASACPAVPMVPLFDTSSTRRPATRVCAPAPAATMSPPDSRRTLPAPLLTRSTRVWLVGLTFFSMTSPVAVTARSVPPRRSRLSTLLASPIPRRASSMADSVPIGRVVSAAIAPLNVVSVVLPLRLVIALATMMSLMLLTWTDPLS